MNVLAKEAPEVARTIINSGKEEIAGFLVGGENAGAEPLLNGFGNVIREKGEQVFEKEIGRAIEFGKKLIIKTPHGDAVQSMTKEALLARAEVAEGRKFYRIGMKGQSNTGKNAQFWSLEHPLNTPSFGKRYGIPEENLKNIDFIETATIKPNASFITRPAPGVGKNIGGNIEVVVPENSSALTIETHVSL